MAENTVTGQQAMFQIAHNCQRLFSGAVTTAGSATSLTLANIQEASDDTYNGGYMREMGASVYATISDYTGSTRVFTLASPGLTSAAVSDVLQWIYGQDRSPLFESVNSAIRESWGLFSRETTVNAASATITLTAGTHTYSLPTGVGKLLRVGIQPASTDSIFWFDPLKIWRVEGEEGAYTIRFLPGYFGGGSPSWSSRVQIPPRSGVWGSFADAWAGESLCLHYIGREPELTAETGQTRLPLNYLGWVGADYFSQWLLANGSDNDRRIANVSLPQIQQNAFKAKAQLHLTKARPPQPIELVL